MTAPRSVPMPSLIGIVLAAGASSRFGSPKALALFRGRTLLEHAIMAFAGLSQVLGVVVLVGADCTKLTKVAHGCGAEVLHHKAWARGMTASLRAAVVEAQRCHAAGALISAVDQPSANASHFLRLIQRFESGATIVASAYEDTVGLPTLFAERHFAEVLALRDDERGKDFILRHKECMHTAMVSLARGGQDIDTQAELERLQLQPESSEHSGTLLTHLTRDGGE
jgi:molybdenum cofactor cytidylyltransferase